MHVVIIRVMLLHVRPARLLGLPLIPAYSEANGDRDRMRFGVNYASAAAGILDITGRNFVSTAAAYVLILR